MNEQPIGKYRWCWAGAESGYDVPMNATSFYYDIRRPCNTIREDVVQILICDIFGKRWINVDKSDLITIE